MIGLLNGAVGQFAGQLLTLGCKQEIVLPNSNAFGIRFEVNREFFPDLFLGIQLLIGCAAIALKGESTAGLS